MSSSRRDFLTALSAGGLGILVSDWDGVRGALDHAHAVQQGTVQARFEVLTAIEAADFTAFAARIMPTTDTPGATEAGVVYFADRFFATTARDGLPDFRAHVGSLGTRAAARRPSAKRFADLTPAEQDAVITEIHDTDAFRNLRSLVMLGMFADPKYGGNRAEVGWKLIGFENRMAYTPPFGYYDAQASGGRD